MVKEYWIAACYFMLTLRLIESLLYIDECSKYRCMMDLHRTCKRFDNDSVTVESFVTFLDIPCPPQNKLHLVCNANLSSEPPTCDERLSIIERCLLRFPGIYNDSLWDTCLMDENKCENIVDYLTSSGFIGSVTKETIVTISVTSSILVTSDSVTDSSTVDSTTLDTDISSSLSTTKRSITSESVTSSDVVPTVTESDSDKKDSSTTEMGEDDITTAGDDFPPPLSAVYPVIGSFIILCEIAILCTLFCYKKRKQKAAAQGSLVQQEEVIEAESASPTKALRPKFDEDTKTEDEKIYRSYINLKYIDESVESTPEKIALRT
ncbi:hypothetical protein ACF0H5_002748 [Mactra antiquata]